MTVGTTSAEHFGEALRNERQQRSVSLEDIAQTTKVTVRSLRALESDAFDQLPGGILGKGIVRSYVRYLGLDEGEWVDRFLSASGQKSPASLGNDKDWAAFALNISSTREAQGQNLRLRWVGVVALLLLLAGLGWIVWGYVHQRMTALNNPPVTHYAASTINAAPNCTVCRRACQTGPSRPFPFAASIGTPLTHLPRWLSSHCSLKSKIC